MCTSIILQNHLQFNLLYLSPRLCFYILYFPKQSPLETNCIHASEKVKTRGYIVKTHRALSKSKDMLPVMNIVPRKLVIEVTVTTYSGRMLPVVNSLQSSIMSHQHNLQLNIQLVLEFTQKATNTGRVFIPHSCKNMEIKDLL